jgi:hypothetical protein
VMFAAGLRVRLCVLCVFLCWCLLKCFSFQIWSLLSLVSLLDDYCDVFCI